MTYRPPFARMRQIKADAPPKPSTDPVNVEEALLTAPPAPADIRVSVGAVDVVVEAGDDHKFGTPDDHHHIVQAGAESPVTEPKVIEEEPLVAEVVEPEVPTYDKLTRKTDLVALAAQYGVVHEDTATKAEILAALDAHFGE